MRATAIDRYGDVDELDVRDMVIPRPRANELVIRIDTAGVGGWDAEMRSGDVKTEHGFPLVLGTDGAGVVVETGSSVRRLRRGDRVWSYVFDNPGGGFHAEYVVVAERTAARVPTSMDLQHAGALTVLGLTALQGVDDALRLERGESVIVHGASGNVGMIAVQLAAWRGANVLAIASGTDGVEFVRRLSAVKNASGEVDVIDGKTIDILEAARLFAPEGVDAVLAFAGGEALTHCLDALRRGGRVAHPNGVEPAPRKRKHIRLKSYDAVASPAKFSALNRAVVASGLDVPIARALPLDRVREAHRLVEQEHLGRVVLTTR